MSNTIDEAEMVKVETAAYGATTAAPGLARSKTTKMSDDPEVREQLIKNT
jgi:hypothetical protein